MKSRLDEHEAGAAHRARQIAVSFAIFAFMLIVAEGFLHLTPLRGYLTSSVPPEYAPRDPDVLYRIAPDFPTTTVYTQDISYPIWSNSQGCFDVEHDPDAVSIYVTGDSFAWGFAPFEDKWATKISDLLGVSVAKCGVLGYGTKQELEKAKEDLETFEDTKLIILSYFENDIYDDAWLLRTTAGAKEKSFSACSEKSAPSLWEGAKCYLSHHSIVYVFSYSLLTPAIESAISEPYASAIRAFISPALPPRIELNADDFEFHAANIREFKQLAEDHDARLLVVRIPSKAEASGNRVAPQPLEIKSNIEDILKQEGILYLDLAPEYARYPDEAPLYWTRDPHLNIAGNRLSGILIARYIVAHDLLPIADKEETLRSIEKALSGE